MYLKTKIVYIFYIHLKNQKENQKKKIIKKSTKQTKNKKTQRKR